MEVRMAKVNTRRVLIGALGGTVIWIAWSIVVEWGMLMSRYTAAQNVGQLLAAPRYPLFFFVWIVTFFLLSWILAWLYANLRDTLGKGPRLALKLGLTVGFAAGFPIAFIVAAWSPLERIIPLWWCLELWIGAFLSAIVSGWLYKEPKA
jgi:hypothetical protein